jgi:hypothetical protein
MLINKFASAVAEAEADPKKQTSVREFVGQTDYAASFFEFIQGLQKLDKNSQLRVQQEVFGEKQVLKMADFLQTDFATLAKSLGGPTSEQLSPRLEKLGDLNDLKDRLEAQRNLSDVMGKSRSINEGMVRSQHEAAKLELQRENMNIQNFHNLAEISKASNEIGLLLKEGILGLTGMIVKVTDLANNVKKISESSALKGIMRWVGGK